MSRLLNIVKFLFLLPLVCALIYAEESVLETAGMPSAPLDATQRLDPAAPLSHSQRAELLDEFKGLVHLGLRKTTYAHWEGKDMADCEEPKNSNERWSLRCEILTGQASGAYYFYPSESRQAATLQHLDVRVDAGDEKLLDDFRRPVQEFLGRASLVAEPMVHAKTSGPIRHWNTGGDVAELFMDRSQRPEGSVRLVWMRSPLVGGEQAWRTDFNTGN